MAQGPGFLTFIVIIFFAGAVAFIGMKEIHYRYQSGGYSDSEYSKSLNRDLDHVKVFYGARESESAGFSKVMIDPDHQSERLNDDDKDEANRIFWKWLR